MNYETIIDNLEKKVNFSFARYGDGEFNAILGASPKQNQYHNCDGHRYFKDMGMRLYQIILSNPEYEMGLQPMVKRLRENDADYHTLINHVDHWHDADVLHKASMRGELTKMFEALKERDIIIVANENIIPMANHIAEPWSDTLYNHIIVSPRDCWLEYQDVLKRLAEIITKDVVILYCASMMSEVLIDDVYGIYQDEITQIDIGSAFDPYVGEKTRSYHKKLNL